MMCRQRAEIESLADNYLSQNGDYIRLKTVPGIGPIIALTIFCLTSSEIAGPRQISLPVST
jgi:hypothetical protein